MTSPQSQDPVDLPVYNTAAVVRQTELPAATFRAWERRYGFPKPARDAAGQRLYSEREIAAIRWLADQTARGVAVSRAIDMLRRGYAAPESTTADQARSGRSGPSAAPAVSAARESVRSLGRLLGELLNALLDFDATAADHLVTEAFALYSIEDVCERILEPLLVDVGERWHAGDLSVSEEHYVSSFVRARLFVLLHAYERRDPTGPMILTGCAPNEWHEVGILLVSLFLVKRGYNVRFLGPNVPVRDLASVVERQQPAMVILSAHSEENARALVEAGAALATDGRLGPSLAFGGRVFNLEPKLRTLVDGIYVGPDASATVAAVEALLGAVSTPHRRQVRTRPPNATGRPLARLTALEPPPRPRPAERGGGQRD